MMQMLMRLVYLACLAWLIACLGMYVMQRKLLYMPQPRHVAAPVMTMQTDVGNVLVSTRENPGPNALIYFGGNAEDVSFSLEELAQIFPGQALYLPHYRGFGGSAGEPDEAALVADAVALFDQISARHPNVVVIGRSLGSGVAVQLAAQRPVQRLALVTPFDSAERVAGHFYPWLPVRWLLKDKFDSLTHVRGVTVPVLVLSAGRDQVVPAENTRRLIDRIAPAQITLREFPDAGHDDIAGEAGYSAALGDFLRPGHVLNKKDEPHV